MTRKPAIGVLDLGASGGRVFTLVEDRDQLRLLEIHRFYHAPQYYWQMSAGSPGRVRRPCWNLGGIYNGLLEGLTKIAQRDDIYLQSFGIDTWGSDGTWVNAAGDMLSLVATGRDERWQTAATEISTFISRKELFYLTGVRSDPFCVLNQIYWYVQHEPRLVDAATTYMPFNSLLHYFLSGQRMAEYTWMSTTQLSLPGQATYHTEVFNRLGLPLEKMPALARPGTSLGRCHPELATSLGLPSFEVIMPATHDTASAYAAVPVKAGGKPILISSGTWTLVGVAEDEPRISDEVYAAGLTNIAGCGEMYLHAVIMGNWPAQRLCQEWSISDGHEVSWDDFSALAVSTPAMAILIDVDAPGFYSPESMQEAIVGYCRSTGQMPPESRAQMARGVYEGLALKTALACERLQEVAGRRCDEVIVVGGGSHNHLVNQWIANATGLPVCTGSAHAAALGNALVQAKTLGWVGSLSEGHSLLDSDVTKRVFEPHTSTQWADAKQRIKRWAQQ